MAERLNVNVTLLRNQKTGEVVEIFAYSGAVELQVSATENFVMEFRGMMDGPAVGKDAAERMSDAEQKVKVKLQEKLEQVKLAVPGISTMKPNGEEPPRSGSANG